MTFYTYIYNAIAISAQFVFSGTCSRCGGGHLGVCTERAQRWKIAIPIDTGRCIFHSCRGKNALSQWTERRRDNSYRKRRQLLLQKYFSRWAIEERCWYEIREAVAERIPGTQRKCKSDRWLQSYKGGKNIVPGCPDKNGRLYIFQTLITFELNVRFSFSWWFWTPFLT